MALDKVHTLLIVPARGGSKEIPRKNLKLLGGQPLITHILSTAQGITDAHLIVSTDDEEITRVAHLSGVETIPRPASLASDEATLDEAVSHACSQAESLHKCRYEKVVTLQPTSPFTSAESIQAAIEMLDSSDSVISVKDSRHLRWTDGDDGPRPLYSDRVNRQWLPPTWEETGGLIACRRTILDSGSRIGGKITLLKLEGKESLDIDTHTDWVMAESLLTIPRTVIRVIGDEKHGLGHVFRGLTLADSMYTKPLFIVNQTSIMAKVLIEKRNYECQIYEDAQELVDILIKEEIDVLINDVLDTDAQQMEFIRDSCGCLLINFEDLGSGSATSDITFNALYEHQEPLENQRYGWRWFCLRDEFIHTFSTYEKESDSTNVIVIFGGTDPRDLTHQSILNMAAETEIISNINLTVVVGPGNPHLEKIRETIAQSSSLFASVELLNNVVRMSDVMRTADFAITSNGRTVFELAACRVPMIVICQNERETTHTFTRHCGAAIDLGFSAEFPETDFIEAFRAMCLDEGMRIDMATALQQFNLVGGTQRVISEINQLHTQRRMNDE